MNKRKALVTGGTRGIGYAIAEELLSNGMEVYVTGTSEAGNGPSGSHYISADFCDAASIEMLVGWVSENKVDVLVNNAGINKIDKFAEINLDDFDRIMRVNLRVPLQLCQAAMPHMKEQNWGRIVNISSIFSTISKELRASYSASKFGLYGMTTALAAEVSEFGILANCVAPGFIDTDLTRSVLGEDGIKELQNKIPIKRLGKTDEIASLVGWLAGENNKYMTGQNVVIDGGFSRV